ncbi:aminodeoxychorismate synthase component I [bacterium]|nr:aminodeoxychorismate synthase component I [bacterium]
MVHKHHILEEYRHEAPFWRLGEAFAIPGRSRPFLLDSALAEGRLGRWSYLGPAATQTFEAWRNPDGTARVRTGAPGLGRRLDVADPFEQLARWWGHWRIPAAERVAHPAPFLHGAVGWIGFEAGHCLERWPDTGVDDLGLPDIHFGVHPFLLIHDNETDRTWLSAVGSGVSAEKAASLAQEIRRFHLRRLEAWRPGPDPAAAPPSDISDALPAPFVPQARYLEKVRRIQADIRDGRVFECCLTHRFEQPFAGDPWALYAVLRRDNPAPFAGYLAHEGATVICASPERFLRLTPDGGLETRPIKGTRPRGADPVADARLRDDLAASEKDRAENVMIVDLARNDLGRVCETGSVRVAGLCEVEGYATVWQLVSTVRGKLREGLDGIDAIRASFPGGSMTGAPKIEALRMIDELEHHVRGVYAGAFGWLGCDGALDLNMVIRTIVAKGGRATYGTGGAVTADSDPEAEWRESLDKVRALARAVATVNDSRT